MHEFQTSVCNVLSVSVAHAHGLPVQAPDSSIIPSADRCSCHRRFLPASIHSAVVYQKPSVNAMWVSVIRPRWSHTVHPHALFTSSLAFHPHAFIITGIQTRVCGSMSERNQIIVTRSLGTPKAGHAMLAGRSSCKSKGGQLFFARELKKKTEKNQTFF